MIAKITNDSYYKQKQILRSFEKLYDLIGCLKRKNALRYGNAFNH